MDLLWPHSPDANADDATPAGRHASAGTLSSVPADDHAEPRPSAPMTGDMSPVAEWQRLLVEAGFSAAEAKRLIFERLCPRDEGVRRQ